MTARFTEDVSIQGNLRVAGTMPKRDRADLTQENLAAYPIPLTEFSTWDALATNLPAAAGNDDLGLVTGTLGTDSPTLQAGDLKAAGATTRYARCQVPLPPEYVAGETVQLRVSCGMKTTAADTSCTIDVQAYETDREGAVGSDLCATAAQDMNDTAFADQDFTITATGLAPGDLLDIRLAIACNDGATGTAVIPTIGQVELLCDIKG